MKEFLAAMCVALVATLAFLWVQLFGGLGSLPIENIAHMDLGVTIATLLLFCAMVVQIRMFQVQLRMMRHDMRSAAKAANAAKVSADADLRNLDREETLFRLRVHAEIRPAFNFANELEAGAPPGTIVLSPINLGAGRGTLKEVMVRCSEQFEAPQPAHYQVHSTSEILVPFQATRINFTIPALPDQYLYGLVRWQDVVGRHRYRFCMRVRPERPEGARFNFFHEWGTREGWNREEPDPDAYVEQ